MRRTVWRGTRTAITGDDITEWTLSLATLTLVVHRLPNAHHLQWFGTCVGLNISARSLGESGTSAEDAQRKMIVYVQGCLERMTADIAKVFPTMGK